MKKQLFAICLCISGQWLFAQKNIDLSALKGKTVTGTANVTADMDMGMGTMNTKNDLNFEMKLIGEDASSYQVTYNIKRMKMDMDGMQKMSYDSDNPADESSPLAESMKDFINKPDTQYLDKTTLRIIKDKSKKTESPAMAMGTGQQSSAEGLFLFIPSGTDAGKTWETETKEEGLTTKNTYTLLSMQGGKAKVKVKTTTSGTTEKEVMGQSMNMTIDQTMNSEVDVDVKTFLIEKNTMQGEMNNSMDMGGQQMQMSTKLNSVTTSSLR